MVKKEVLTYYLSFMVYYCISNYAINSEKLCALGIIYRFDYDKIPFNLEFFKMAKCKGISRLL